MGSYYFFLVNPAVYLGISDYVNINFVEKQHSFLLGITIILFDFEHIFHGSRRRNISNINTRCCSVQEVNTFNTNVKKKMNELFELCDLC